MKTITESEFKKLLATFEGLLTERSRHEMSTVDYITFHRHDDEKDPDDRELSDEEAIAQYASADEAERIAFLEASEVTEVFAAHRFYHWRKSRDRKRDILAKYSSLIELLRVLPREDRTWATHASPKAREVLLRASLGDRLIQG